MKAGKDKRIERLIGKVVRKDFARGSKSEHEAICLQTKTVSYKLTLSGGNPFHDDRLEQLVGKRVTVTGIIADYLVIANKVEEMKDE